MNNIHDPTPANRISLDEAVALQLRVISSEAKGSLGVVAAYAKVAESDLVEFTKNYAWLVADEFKRVADYYAAQRA